MTLYRDSDSFLFFAVRNGIGQTSGQAFDVRRLHENQEHEGLYLELEQYVAVHRKSIARSKLLLEPGQPIWLKIALIEETQKAAFFFSLDGITYKDFGIELSVEFLYPEMHTRFLCFTAPRIGIYAKGVYGEQEGRVLFQKFTYQDQVLA